MTADSAAGEGVMGVSSSTGEGLCSEKLKVFKSTPPKNAVNNIVFESSLLAKLEEDKSFPHDCSVHVYMGSTANEKLKILDDYPKKSSNFYPTRRNNNILKFNKSAGDIISEFNELVIKC